MGKNEIQLKNWRGYNAGTITIMNMELDFMPSLHAYLKNKWQISVGVAIDFTLSNLEYENPKSRHF